MPNSETTPIFTEAERAAAIAKGKAAIAASRAAVTECTEATENAPKVSPEFRQSAEECQANPDSAREKPSIPLPPG